LLSDRNRTEVVSRIIHVKRNDGRRRTAYIESPLYVAVTLFVPANQPKLGEVGEAGEVSEAIELEEPVTGVREAAPISELVELSKKPTVPEGAIPVPVPTGETIAVNVTVPP
jgi:hypothetical protein